MQERIIRVTADGAFDRKESEFRDIVGDGPFAVEKGRYHLYVCIACPWSHRTLLARKLLGLEDAIDVSYAHWLMDADGAWHFRPEEGYEDKLYGADSLQDVYAKADPTFRETGTVPVLWDKKADKIVNNESREIVRMFGTAFRALQDNDVTLLPEGREDDVDAMITANYESVNNGVYKAGFAKSQPAYEAALYPIFERLDALEDLLGDQRYLLGDRLTEADVCLWPTLVRFDAVYLHHFKCNLKRLVEYPNLWEYTRDIYQHPGVGETFDLDDTKRHYYVSHQDINPTRIVPAGPVLEFDAPHDRDERFS